MEIKTYSIQGLVRIEPRVFQDARGFFLESYNRRAFHDAGITQDFVQDNHSKSARWTLRGLHYQVRHPQAKLVRAVRGEIFDVAVDIRPNSPTFGQWRAEILSEHNHYHFFVPEGFAHGFLVLSETAEVLYKCSDFYSPSDDRGILWSDPRLNIDWPLQGHQILSAKDQGHPLFKDLRLT